MAFILSILMVFLAGCSLSLDDFNIFKSVDGSVGAPKAGEGVNIKIPGATDFDFEISQELLDFLQSLDSFDIENITSIEDLRVLLRDIDPGVDVNLDQLLALINNMNEPTVPVTDVGGYIYVSLYISCPSLENLDPGLYGSASSGGVVLDKPSIPVKTGSTVNDVMNDLAVLTGVSIPVVIDGSGNITSINGIANGVRPHPIDPDNYNCYWNCSVNDEPPTGGSQGYSLQSGDIIVFYYRCDKI